MNKLNLKAYREAAAAVYPQVTAGALDWRNMRVSVPPHGEIRPVDGGAFVEAVVWVPDAALIAPKDK